MSLLELFSLIKSDLSRLSLKHKKINFFVLAHPRFFPVLFIRLSRYFYLKPIIKPISYIFLWLNVILFGIECSPRVKIGRGLLIPHSHGIVIGANFLGDNVTIFQGVTLGAKSIDLNFAAKLRPKVANRVLIGAGAKVLGGISIEDDVVIAANAVVVKNIPRNSLVAGIPAKKIRNLKI